MLKELFTASLGMMNSQTRLEVTANNIANASTTGFKRAEIFERNLIDARANFYNVKGDIEQNDPPIGSYYDFTNGAFENTQNPLDIAIEGKGFFVLQDVEGKEYFTRAGNFSISESGEIIAQDGKKLMGENGVIAINKEFMSNPLITRDTREISLRISQNGEIFFNDYEVGKLLVVMPGDLNTLQKISNQNFIATWESEVIKLDDGEFNIRQGWLENSNVNIVQEMIKMIELQRMFEAGSKVIQTNDNTIEKSLAMSRFY